MVTGDSGRTRRQSSVCVSVCVCVNPLDVPINRKKFEEPDPQHRGLLKLQRTASSGPLSCILTEQQDSPDKSVMLSVVS